MAEKMDKGKNMCDSCGGCTGRTCGVIMGLVFIIAGAMLYLGGKYVAWSGILFVLIGLGKLVHKLCMCPMCKCS